MDLGGAVAIVTGGASGIGAATTERLQRGGARVAVLDIDPQQGRGEQNLACDVSDEHQVQDAVAAVVDELGAPSIAVLAAGVGGSSAILDMSTAEWDRINGVNLRGVFLCLRETARAMTAAKLPGAIVAVGSVSGIASDRYLAHYGTTKAGVHHLVRIAAAELGEHAIRVNAVAPGCTDTPMFAAVDLMPGYREQVAERAALGRVGSADEVAQAIIALVELDWVTGQVLAADGGILLRSPLDPADAMNAARRSSAVQATEARRPTPPDTGGA